METRSPSWLDLEQQPMELGIVERYELAGERRRLGAERPRPGLHGIGRHPPEAVLHLRDERVVLEAELAGEVDLGQPGIRAQLLKPTPGLLALLLRFRRRSRKSHRRPRSVGTHLISR